MIALNEILQVSIRHGMLTKRKVNICAKIVDPDFLCLTLWAGETLIEENHICLYTRLVKNAGWQTENGVQIRGVQQLFTDDLACTTLKQNVIRYNNGRLSGRLQNRIDMLDKVELFI